MKVWNPTAKNCKECQHLKPLIEKVTKNPDPDKKSCDKFSWEITNELAERSCACKLELSRQRRLI